MTTPGALAILIRMAAARYHANERTHVVTQPASAARSRLAGLRERRWTAGERALVIAVLAIVMGSLFVMSYSLALGDPVPNRIVAGLVGDAAGHARTVEEVQRTAEGSLVFHRYPSVAPALRAL